VPRLPAFDPQKQINQSPHVVILGAGASRAAFPSGDAKKKRLPLLVDLPDCLDLRAAITKAGFPASADFESIYDELATTGRSPSLKAEIESKVRGYFESLEMPDEPTLYDYLLLSLRETDLIATFDWDPFLARAFIRNRGVAAMPQRPHSPPNLTSKRRGSMPQSPLWLNPKSPKRLLQGQRLRNPRLSLTVHRLSPLDSRQPRRRLMM